MGNQSMLRFEVRDGVARLELNHPPANAIDAGLARELRSVAIRCDEDPQIRAVLLRGAGSTFCGGGDINAFVGQGGSLPVFVKDLTTDLHAAISRFARMTPPLIAAVHGYSAGAGLSLVCAADLVLAGEAARFTMAYTRIGLTPDGSSTYFLPRLVGLRRAVALTLTNRTLTAAEALEWGIVTEVVPDAELFDRADTLAASLATGPTRAFGGAKRLFQASFTETLESQMEQETRVLADAARTADAHEGISAFAAKRPPKFSGA